MTSVPFFLLFFVVVVIYSAWRGGAPEKAIAAAYLLALIASASVGIIHISGHFRKVPLPLMATDLLLLIAMCVIAVRANRWWIIPAAGGQLVAVLVHASKLLDPSLIFLGYGFLTKIWSWPMVALLGLGTWAHRRRIAEGIVIPDWKPSFAQARSRPLRGRRPS